MNTWVISDTHFGHNNVIKYENRPYNSAEEMDETLIENWNNKVKPNDDIYILGDFIVSNSKEYAKSIIERLNGNKYLIAGNHDKISNNPEMCSYFKFIKRYHTLTYKDKYIVMFHFPILSWNRKNYGSIHLYGHIHTHELSKSKEMLELMKNSYNVCADVNDYAPVLLDDIINVKK